MASTQAFASPCAVCFASSNGCWIPKELAGLSRLTGAFQALIIFCSLLLRAGDSRLGGAGGEQLQVAG